MYSKLNTQCKLYKQMQLNQIVITKSVNEGYFFKLSVKQ